MRDGDQVAMPEAPTLAFPPKARAEANRPRSRSPPVRLE